MSATSSSATTPTASEVLDHSNCVKEVVKVVSSVILVSTLRLRLGLHMCSCLWADAEAAYHTSSFVARLPKVTPLICMVHVVATGALHISFCSHERF